MRLRPAGLALLLLSAGAVAAAPGDETQHVVAQGETLNGIANRAGVTPDTIIAANGLKAPYALRIGQKLAIPRPAKPVSRTASARAGKPAVPDKSAARATAAPAAKPAPRPAPAPVAPASERPSLANADSHVVEAGETLGSIAARAHIPRVLIAEANSLAPPYAVRTGQKLVLPRTRRHTVKAGDTSFSLAYDYGVPWQQIAIANGLAANAPLPVGKTLLIPTVIDPQPPTAPPTPAPKAAPALAIKPAPNPVPARFAWPLSGPVRRGFIPRTQADHHDGIDITAPRDAPVRAAAAGTVIFAENEPDQFGNLVIIDHGKGWHSAYSSLSRITVRKGLTVVQGERVGLVGDTGVSRRTELHFELRKDGKPVDPAGELPPAP